LDWIGEGRPILYGSGHSFSSEFWVETPPFNNVEGGFTF
jgi:hypothetical protein